MKRILGWAVCTTVSGTAVGLVTGAMKLDTVCKIVLSEGPTCNTDVQWGSLVLGYVICGLVTYVALRK